MFYFIEGLNFILSKLAYLHFVLNVYCKTVICVDIYIYWSQFEKNTFFANMNFWQFGIECVLQKFTCPTVRMNFSGCKHF